MKVFTNGTDTVVAENLIDVAEVLTNHYGSTMEQEGWTLDEWGQVDDNTPIVSRNVNGNGYDDKATRTAAEWAAQNGRGFLCSTEW